MTWEPVKTLDRDALYFGPASGQDKTNDVPLDPYIPEKKPPMGPWFNEPKSGAESSPELSQTWDEFTQKTTFHGVRYIFDETPFRVRR